MRGLAFSTLVFTLWCTSPAAASEVYKWVDDHGRVHYTDRVPGDAQAADTLELREPAATGDGQRARQDKQRRLLEAFEAERMEREEAEARARAEAQERAGRCERARRELAAVEQASLVYTRGQDGERRYMSDEERARATSQTRAWIAKWCR